jgi:hypothetical protein
MSLTLLKTIVRWGGFACVALLIGFGVKPEGAAAQSFDVSGFVKSSHYYDTRQVVTARDIDFLLYPTPDGDPDADDPSDRDNLSSFLLFSRLGLNVSDFDQKVLGADVRAYMEADFFGPGVFTSGTTRTGQENFFRLRRGFAEMKWDNREVLFGLEWTPLFTLDAFPHTVATEAGAPFNPLSRQPMVKLTLKPTDNLRLIGITAWQFDAFVDAPLANAPEGSNPLGGIDAQQQSALPGLHGHLQYDNGTVLLGVGGYLESLRPFPMGDRFFSGAGTVYGTYTSSNFIARGKVTYGDVRDHVSVGGYIYDPATAGSEFGAADAFKQINTLSTWVEFEKPGTFSPGLFAGYLTNLGTSDELDSAPSDVAWATRSHSPTGQSIASVWEVAPRLALNYGPMRFAFEVQVTTAQYTTRLDENFAPDPLDSEEAVTNVRGDFTVFLFF